MNRVPVAVIISDIHFTPATLEEASEALNESITFSNALNVPLIIAGDTLDSKSIIRAECANRLIDILSKRAPGRTKILVGNHDLLNEKDKENALHFLRPYADIVSHPVFDNDLKLWLIPYISDSKELLATLQNIPKGSTLVMHQGVQGAHMGHYVQDKTSLPKEVFKDFRVFSGHYHKAQEIKCADNPIDNVGMFIYAGNPYTLSFGEASDGKKGFIIICSDGGFHRVHCDQIRKHIVKELSLIELSLALNEDFDYKNNDLLWLKVTGPKSELAKLNKKDIGQKLIGHSNYKLDLIPMDDSISQDTNNSLKDTDILDRLIDNMQETEEQKIILKTMWKDLIA